MHYIQNLSVEGHGVLMWLAISGGYTRWLQDAKQYPDDEVLHAIDEYRELWNEFNPDTKQPMLIARPVSEVHAIAKHAVDLFDEPEMQAVMEFVGAAIDARREEKP